MKFKHLLLAIVATTSATTVSATTYFVTPEGAGSMDGLTWENAMSHDMIRTNTSMLEDGDVLNYAEGTYYYQGRTEISKTVSIRGGYSINSTGTDVTNKDGVTIMNGNEAFGTAFKIATATGATATTRGNVYIENIDFTGAQFTKTSNTGALWLDNNTGAKVFVSNCNFYDNTVDNADNNNGGGAAIFSHRSSAVITECTFTDNKASNRGGAIRLTSDNNAKGFTVIDRCLFADNKLTDNNAPFGGALFMAHGQVLDIINSTFTNNSAGKQGGAISVPNGPDGNYKRALNIVSCTFADNVAESGSEIYVNAAVPVTVLNSVIVDSEYSQGNACIFATADLSATNFIGNNYIGTVTEGYVASETDKVGAQNTYSSYFGENILEEAGVIEPVLFVEGSAPEALTSATAQWPVGVNATVDQIGNVRTSSTSNGAYAISNSTGLTTVPTLNQHCIFQGVGHYQINGATKVNVYSVDGRLVKVFNGENVNLTHLSKGIYILRTASSSYKVNW